MNAPLKVIKETILSVDYQDLERYILQVTGHKACLPSILECSNDTYHRFTVNREPEPPAERLAHLASLLHHPVEEFCIDEYLNAMCQLGHLEPGTYVVSVSW
jgi:hypothetical protein